MTTFLGIIIVAASILAMLALTRAYVRDEVNGPLAIAGGIAATIAIISVLPGLLPTQRPKMVIDITVTTTPRK